MRAPRIHVEQPLAGCERLVLQGQAGEHLVRVLRLRTGAPLVLFDGHGGEYAATLGATTRAGVEVALGAHAPRECESPLQVTLLQALARSEKMDLVVQKATELGVARIVPVATERSVVQLGSERAGRRADHWRGVAIAACEQCGRNRVPRVDAPLALEAALRAFADDAHGLRCRLEPAAPASLAAQARGARALVLLVGPEGGLTEAEGMLADRAGFAAASLGPRVLRTETAALAALAALGAIAGDLG